MVDVCVIGAGPAGSTFAARMAELGHEVCLIERARFPRRHLGESLSPGVLPLLDTIGAREAAEASGFRRVHSVVVKWDAGLQVRQDSRQQGLIVDRGSFDTMLLERARALGVRVLQPAVLRTRRHDENGWHVCIEAEGRTFHLRAAFIADASGRAASTRGRKTPTGCRTLALYSYWRGSHLAEQPRIEAGNEAWYWGVPLPDGTYNTLVFVDMKHFRMEKARPLATRFRELLDRSGLMTGCRDARLIGPVLAADATPYLDRESVTPSSIKIGEAALAIDPLSSSGVQKAIQTALAGAVVCNTLLRGRESSDAALRFYRQNLADASERHGRWAAAHYASVATRGGGAFWNHRASHIEPQPASLASDPIDAYALSMARIELSDQLEFVDLPSIEGDFVTVKPAVRHPGLEGPVTYLGGWELAPLLRRLPVGLTMLQLAQSWAASIPLKSALAIAGWLLNKGILVGKTVERRELT